MLNIYPLCICVCGSSATSSHTHCIFVLLQKCYLQRSLFVATLIVVHSFSTHGASPSVAFPASSNMHTKCTVILMFFALVLYFPTLLCKFFSLLSFFSFFKSSPSRFWSFHCFIIKIFYEIRSPCNTGCAARPTTSISVSIFCWKFSNI